MKVETIRVDGKVVLAPLAGITDSPFRAICREKGAALVFTEMISADGIVQQNKRTLDYLYFREQERPIGFQLFGSDPSIMARAVEIVLSHSPDFIDINYGCPVKKVVKRNAGSALLQDIPMLRRITEAVVRTSTVPVLAKIRKGWDENAVNAMDVAKLLEQCGVRAVTIHPRTKAEQFRGHSDWSLIRRIKQELSIPVIGNGDIVTAEDAQRMIDETGCDMVMIGRASLGNPWIFESADQLLRNGALSSPPSNMDRLALILKHLHDMVELNSPTRGVREMRKHIGWYLKGLPHSSIIKNELFKLTTEQQVIDFLSSYFDRISTYERLQFFHSNQEIPA
ncbi:MAG: tRNA dihydrouridine synthase DusB [Candidatus Zhuqueibacterota bacterium]